MNATQMLQAIRRYCNAEGMADSTFGRRAVNDPRFVYDLRKGRQPHARIAGRVSAFLRGEAC